MLIGRRCHAKNIALNMIATSLISVLDVSFLSLDAGPLIPLLLNLTIYLEAY